MRVLSYVVFMFVLSVTFIVNRADAVPTQGTLGFSSTGIKNISVSFPAKVQITNIADIAFGTYGGSGDLTDNDNVCIHSTGGGGYNITATGSGAGSAFTLAGASTTLVYDVHWDDVTASSYAAGTDLNTGVALTSQTGASASATCSGGDNATVSVQILEAALLAADAGDTYTGTLTLVIAPE